MMPLSFFSSSVFKLAPGSHKMFPFGKGFEKVEDKMFKRRMFQQHAGHVVTMLDNAVQSLGPDLVDLEEVLVNLGARHVGYGILPEHYPIVGQALLETLATGLGEKFDDDLKGAWAGVYGFITTSMLKGANESLLRLSFPLFGPSGTKEEMTLDQYVSSMLPGQTELYYITVTNDASNFGRFEKLKKAQELQAEGVSILHIAKNKQDLLAGNLQKYIGRKMVDVADGVVDTSFLKGLATTTPVDTLSATNREGLIGDVANEFCLWFQNTLGHEKVEACTPTCDFASQPACVIHDDENPNEVKHLEAMSSKQQSKRHVEINPQHPLIVEIHIARKLHPSVAQLLAAQLYDNCLINAGLLNDFRMMVTRVNDLSLLLLQEKNKTALTANNPTSTAASALVPDENSPQHIDRNKDPTMAITGSSAVTSTEDTKPSEEEAPQDNSDDGNGNVDDGVVIDTTSLKGGDAAAESVDEDDITVYSDDLESLGSDSRASIG
jgi:hemoglobin-like flavoprotein